MFPFLSCLLVTFYKGIDAVTLHVNSLYLLLKFYMCTYVSDTYCSLLLVSIVPTFNGCILQSLIASNANDVYVFVRQFLWHAYFKQIYLSTNSMGMGFLFHFQSSAIKLIETVFWSIIIINKLTLPGTVNPFDVIQRYINSTRSFSKYHSIYSRKFVNIQHELQIIFSKDSWLAITITFGDICNFLFNCFEYISTDSAWIVIVD